MNIEELLKYHKSIVNLILTSYKNCVINDSVIVETFATTDTNFHVPVTLLSEGNTKSTKTIHTHNYMIKTPNKSNNARPKPSTLICEFSRS